MARLQSRAIMGFLPIPPEHHNAILSLFKKPETNEEVRFLDPFAGEGVFARVAQDTLGLTSYVNELDNNKIHTLINRFGAERVVQGDAERLRASNEAFQLVWINPPYDIDASEESSNKRVEFKYLKHSWKWIQNDGFGIWVVYDYHVTEAAAEFLAKNCSTVDIFALPGNHQGKYKQVIVVGHRGYNDTRETLYNTIIEKRSNPPELNVHDEPLYLLPEPTPIRNFFFSADKISPERGKVLIDEQGAWRNQGIQALLQIMEDIRQQEPVVAPRPGHLALVLAAGIANGAVIETEKYGRVAIRSKIVHSEEVSKVERIPDKRDEDYEVVKTHIKLKPTVILTLTTEQGDLIEMDGDEHLLAFIKDNKKALIEYLNDKFNPLYKFDYNGLKPYLDGIRIGGKYPLYNSQKHVVAATIRGLQERNSTMIIGQMGVGKTALSATASLGIAQAITETLAKITIDVVQNIRNMAQPGRDVNIIVCPPHLGQKWIRELYGIASKQTLLAKYLHTIEDVRDFMEETALPLNSRKAKFAVIANTMIKLGEGWEPTYIKRKHYYQQWKLGEERPEHLSETTQRIRTITEPQCPSCGATIMMMEDAKPVPATKHYLTSNQRTCINCQQPLWQLKRTFSAAKQKGAPPKGNPRFRIDQFIKQRYADRIFLLIWDEIHEAKATDTGIGEAFSRMSSIAQKTLALTGTPFNGKSSSMFNIEYALKPETRTRYPWGGAVRLEKKDRHQRIFVNQNTNDASSSTYARNIFSHDPKLRGRSESRWVADMGVRERIIEERATFDKESGKFTGTTTYERPFTEAPGCSPLLIAWMLDHAIFFSLKDLGNTLPDYEEIAIGVDLPEIQQDLYDKINKQLKDYMFDILLNDHDNSFRGGYLAWAMGWINSMHRKYEIVHRKKDRWTKLTTEHLIRTIPAFNNEIFPKEQELIDLVQRELDNGRPILIYARQTNTKDIQPRLEELIRKHVPKAKPFILRSSVDTKKRESRIMKEIENGCNVLICNPELVKTGLDLLHFPTIVFYEIIYNLYTMLQAAARSYRANQKAYNLIKVYYFFYKGTMEHTAVQLMSKKQRSSKLLTGDIGLTGLDALTEDDGSFEHELMNTLTTSNQLTDPRDMFTQNTTEDEFTEADKAYWNIGDTDTDTSLEEGKTIQEAEDFNFGLFTYNRQITAVSNTPNTNSESITNLTNQTKRSHNMAEDNSGTTSQSIRELKRQVQHAINMDFEHVNIDDLFDNQQLQTYLDDEIPINQIIADLYTAASKIENERQSQHAITEPHTTITSGLPPKLLQLLNDFGASSAQIKEIEEELYDYLGTDEKEDSYVPNSRTVLIDASELDDLDNKAFAQKQQNAHVSKKGKKETKSKEKSSTEKPAVEKKSRKKKPDLLDMPDETVDAPRNIRQFPVEKTQPKPTPKDDTKVSKNTGEELAQLAMF